MNDGVRVIGDVEGRLEKSIKMMMTGTARFKKCQQLLEN
jgi:hypothetical protein